MSDLLSLRPGSLPEGYTPETWQELYNRMFLLGRAVWPDGYTVFNFGSVAPTPANRAYPWIRIDPSTHILDGLYTYYNGFWCRPHPTPPSSSERRIWTGTLVDLASYDGGDGSATATIYTGPMWEEDTDFQARFPVGAGTLPSTTVLTVGDTGGEEKHTLTIAEMPAHHHPLNPDSRESDQHDSTPGTNVGDFGGTGMFIKQYSITGDTGSGDSHNTMPPYKTIYFIKRTARVYYTA